MQNKPKEVIPLNKQLVKPKIIKGMKLDLSSMGLDTKSIGEVTVTDVQQHRIGVMFYMDVVSDEVDGDGNDPLDEIIYVPGEDEGESEWN